MHADFTDVCKLHASGLVLLHELRENFVHHVLNKFLHVLIIQVRIGLSFLHLLWRFPF